MFISMIAIAISNKTFVISMDLKWYASFYLFSYIFTK